MMMDDQSRENSSKKKNKKGGAREGRRGKAYNKKRNLETKGFFFWKVIPKGHSEMDLIGEWQRSVADTFQVR